MAWQKIRVTPAAVIVSFPNSFHSKTEGNVVASTTEHAPKTLNKFERFKAEKDGLAIKQELDQVAGLGWEAMDEDDRNYRLKWVGVFFRPVTPGKFMLRLRLPSGVISALQMRMLAEIVQRYGEDGSADITTRQNLQLRGILLEDIPDIFQRMEAVGLTSVQSGMDNVRNITASPVAGLDAEELIDTRELVQQLQDMITNRGQGNPEFTNLPRKFNIAVEGGRDNSIHAEINDIAYVPAFREGVLGFNVVVGGFFSATRCAAAVPLNAWVEANHQVVDLSRVILELFRDHGLRANRQKARLMWLIDEWGLERFRSEVQAKLAWPLLPAAPGDAMDWEKRDHLGVYRQKQAGLSYVGLHVPVGRLQSAEMFELARLAEVYGSGELRLTVEQNVILPNVPQERLDALLAEPLLTTFSPQPATLMRSLVSCTGAQFCNFALVETKQRAIAVAQAVEAEMEVPHPVRMHWTGCPNSCGQPQVAEIGFMGTKARKDGKTVEAVDIFMGGRVGKDAHLGEKVLKGIPCDDLKPVLQHLLVQQFGATPKPGVELPPLPVQLQALSTDSATAEATAEATSEVTAMAAATSGVEAPVEAPLPPATTVRVTLGRSGRQVSVDASQPLLQGLAAVGVPLDSSCQSGTCGTCKQRLVSGEVRYEETPAALTEGDRAAGYLLTCVAYPVGPLSLDI